MSSCIRFLQCAGFRFDSPSWDVPDGWKAHRNNDLWQTFEAVLSLCQSEKIEFLFITGNLFEQEYVRKETVERVAGLLAKINGTRIFITPGSRDPLIMTSAYRLAIWPSNVHIFSSGVSSVKIPSYNVTISGTGWTAYHQERPFIDGFQATNDGTLQIMLLHGEVESEKNTEGFIPIQQDQIKASGLDYLALGHQEIWSGIQKAGGTFWADCGAAEARSFHNIGPYGVLLGEIKNESFQFEFRGLGQRYYIEKNLTIDPQSNIEGVFARLLAETNTEERQKHLFRIKLAGPPLDVEALVQPLQNLLETKFRFVEVVSVEERSPEQFELYGISATKHTKGFPTQAKIFINILQERLVTNKESTDTEYWELVQKIGLTALGQGRVLDED